MKSGLAALCAAAVAAVTLAGAPAGAQTTNRLKTCNEEWNAMKANGAVGDRKYADFRKECLSRSGAPETTAPVPGPGTAVAPPPASQPPATTGSRTGTPETAPTTPPVAGQAVFPTAVSPKHANEAPGRGRRLTCLDQYHANKATGGNGGLRWIQKGGGYYSECNRRLKG